MLHISCSILTSMALVVSLLCVSQQDTWRTLDSDQGKPNIPESVYPVPLYLGRNPNDVKCSRSKIDFTPVQHHGSWIKLYYHKQLKYCIATLSGWNLLWKFYLNYQILQMTIVEAHNGALQHFAFFFGPCSLSSWKKCTENPVKGKIP